MTFFGSLGGCKSSPYVTWPSGLISISSFVLSVKTIVIWPPGHLVAVLFPVKVISLYLYAGSVLDDSEELVSYEYLFEILIPKYWGSSLDHLPPLLSVILTVEIILSVIVGLKLIYNVIALPVLRYKEEIDGLSEKSDGKSRLIYLVWDIIHFLFRATMTYCTPDSPREALVSWKE